MTEPTEQGGALDEPTEPTDPTVPPDPTGPGDPAELIARARDWIAGDPDPDTRAELEALLDADERTELAERLDAHLEFGTAGLRGIVGAGPNRMNRAVVVRTTRGLADHLLATDPTAAQRGVIVGFDARHSSRRFAEDTVAVLAAAGIAVRWYTTPQPTPIVAFTQAHLDAAAAVVITASHNPPEYNGYKVYVEGAAQIVPPTDAAIAAAIDAVGPATEVARADLDDPHVEVVDDQVVEDYLAALVAARPAVEGPDLTIAYTPLHGVGGELMLRAFADGGYDDVQPEPSQCEPDGSFPTVRFPNPEEPGAMDAVVALAEDIAADLVIAHDPDADRLAAAVPDGLGGFRMLSGNQIGVLLADHLLRGTDVERPLVVASIVSTPMLRSVAAAYGARAEYTLTGFKWICAAERALGAEGYDFVYGFEEALGSSVGTVVHDKDGIGAAVAFADLVRGLANDGQDVLDRLAELARTHGLWVSRQRSITLPGSQGLAQITDAMAGLSGRVPDDLAGHPVIAVEDYRTDVDQRPPWLAYHDLVSYELPDGRAMIRPSGTEPKVKIYVDLRVDVGVDDDLDVRTAELQDEATAVAEALAAFAGLT